MSRRIYPYQTYSISIIVFAVETTGRDQSFSGERSCYIFHVTSWRLHSRSANEHTELRCEILTTYIDRRTE